MHAEQIAWVTGEDSPNRTGSRFAVGGTDLGIVWDSGGWPHVLFAVGDSFNPLQAGGGGGGGDWRCNLLGWSHDRDLADGMHLAGMLEDRPAHARQFIPRTPGARLDPAPGYYGLVEKTVIPTGGCAVRLSNGRWRQYCAYMSVRVWGAPGRWETNYGGLAYSDDGGITWHKPDTARWWNTAERDQRFQMCALVPAGDHVLLFGTPNGRAGACYLARVHKDHVLDLTRHEQWDGTRWRAGNGAVDQWHTAQVLPGPVSELSVMFHRASGQWLAAYYRESLDAVVVHTAAEPTGPWSPPETVATAAEFPGLYGAFWHPWTADDPEPAFLMSQWVPYNVELMRLRGLTGPVSSSPGAVGGAYVSHLPATGGA